MDRCKTCAHWWKLTDLPFGECKLPKRGSLLSYEHTGAILPAGPVGSPMHMITTDTQSCSQWKFAQKPLT